ncbi:MAG: serine/threonine-protein phosphatase [Candidatus Eremiobacteraeota bacterium]|nr:serine/threonine-protein phosphatase [Candidatus Eremiobacteraeota bacterium]
MLGTATTDDLPTASVEGVLQLLSSTSKLLAAEDDCRAALPQICALLVPKWVEGCAIGLIDEFGTLSVAAQRGSVALDKAGARSSFDQANVSRLGAARWALDAPLLARNQRFGFLRLTGSGEGPAALLPALADELAMRIASAIDTARTIARERHVADTLQRALLPEQLPRNPAAAFDAAYRPGASEAIVGGDWYDAFDLPDGRVALSIGDVAGHGLGAAVVMSEVRQAVRASAMVAVAPTEVLARANQILTMRSALTMVTALFGIFDPQASTFTYASAGHPAPLLGTSDGHVHALPSGGIPLGVGTHVEAVDWTFSLPAGSLLVLYTDGLIEYGRDLFAGNFALNLAVAAEIVSPSSSPARALQERIFASAENNDDVATLTLFVPPAKKASCALTFSAIPLAAPIARRALESFVRDLDVDDDRRFRFISAVGEAVANAIEHAYGAEAGTLKIAATADGAFLRCRVEDSGRWRARRSSAERGRGIPMMRALVDAVEIRTGKASTQVEMRMRIA